MLTCNDSSFLVWDLLVKSNQRRVAEVFVNCTSAFLYGMEINDDKDLIEQVAQTPRYMHDAKNLFISLLRLIPPLKYRK